MIEVCCAVMGKERNEQELISQVILVLPMVMDG
jgi:hypothetical protein